MSSLQIELESFNLVCRFSRGSRYAFWGFQLFSTVPSGAPMTVQEKNSPSSRIFFTWRKSISKSNELRCFFIGLENIFHPSTVLEYFKIYF